MRFERILRLWPGLDHCRQFLLASAQVIKGARYRSLIKRRRATLGHRIAKLEPAMSFVECLQAGVVTLCDKTDRSKQKKT